MKNSDLRKFFVFSHSGLVALEACSGLFSSLGSWLTLHLVFSPVGRGSLGISHGRVYLNEPIFLRDVNKFVPSTRSVLSRCLASYYRRMHRVHG